MLFAVILGFGLGLVVGRYWALPLALLVGIWAAYKVPLENREPPYWDVGLIAAGITVVAMALGIAARSWLLGTGSDE